MKRAFRIGKTLVAVEAPARCLETAGAYLRLRPAGAEAAFSVRLSGKDSKLEGEPASDALVHKAIARGRALGWHFIHSGGIAGRSGASLFVGRSFSGKSTLSLALGLRGHRLLSDELNVLRLVSGRWRAAGFPLVPQARDAALRNVPAVRRLRPSATPRRKWLVPARSGGEAVLERLFFLSYDPAESFRLEPVRPEELAEVLAAHTGGYVSADVDAGLLDFVLTLRKFAREGRVWSCAYSDRGLKALVRALERRFIGPPRRLKKKAAGGIVA